MADAGKIGFSPTTMVRGVHGGNIKQVAGELASVSTGVVDGLARDDRTQMGADIQKIRTEVLNRLPTMNSDALRKSAEHTVLMTAGAIIGGSLGKVIPDVLQHRVHEIASSPEQLNTLAAQVADFHQQPAETPLRPMVYDSMTTQVTAAIVGEGAKPSNVPTALFISGVLLEKDQERGKLPGQE